MLDLQPEVGLRCGAEGWRAISLTIPNAKEQRKSLGPRTRNSAPVYTQVQESIISALRNIYHVKSHQQGLLLLR